MRLVRFTTQFGTYVWVNPDHVAMVWPFPAALSDFSRLEFAVADADAYEARMVMVKASVEEATVLLADVVEVAPRRRRRRLWR